MRNDAASTSGRTAGAVWRLRLSANRQGEPTLRILLHVLPGLIALALAAIIVLRMGSRRQKVVMTAVLVCWIAATLGQVLTGHLTVPLIAMDVVFALWLLWYAWGHAEWWIWAVLALSAAHLLLHAVAYGAPAGIPYPALYDVLSLGALVVIAIAAVLHARRPAGG